jgi:hypothetical protein
MIRNSGWKFAEVIDFCVFLHFLYADVGEYLYIDMVVSFAVVTTVTYNCFIIWSYMIVKF